MCSERAASKYIVTGARGGGGGGGVIDSGQESGK